MFYFEIGVIKRKRIADMLRCPGCQSSIEHNQLVVFHDEDESFTEMGERRVYHMAVDCIRPRHPHLRKHHVHIWPDFRSRLSNHQMRFLDDFLNNVLP